MACYCCVSGCKNNNHKDTAKHFFRFPKNDEKRRKLWKRFARKSNIKATAVICEDHFESRVMVQKDKKLKLSNDAVPTIFFRKTSDGTERVDVEFDGDDFVGLEAEKLNKEIETCKDEEIVKIETAFMDEQLKLDEIKSRCRFCAETKEEVIEMSAFSSYNVDINNLLHFLNIQLVESDFFPNSVCEECFNQVLSLDTFIVKCKTSDQVLWNEFSKLKNISAAIMLPGEGMDAGTIPSSDESFKKNIEPKAEAELSENFYDIIQECESDDDTVPQDMHATTVQNDLDPVMMSSEVVEEHEEKQETLKTTDFAIIDPSCNKFAMKTYKCEVCAKIFAGFKTFRNHICDVPEISCAECNNVFKSVFALQSHRKHLHLKKDERNYCPICKAVISGKATEFKKHKAKCNRGKAEGIQCELCDKVSTI